VLDRDFVPLRGSPLGLLLRKAQRVEHAAHVVRVVLHSKPLANDLRHTAAGPEVVAKARRQGAGTHDLG
jgi:hypothetical protein